MRISDVRETDAEVDRSKAERISSAIGRLADMGDEAHARLQFECERTVSGRSAAASVLTDALDQTGWRYPDLERRFPESSALINAVLQQSVLTDQFSTVQHAAICDALVAVLCREVAEVTGSRLYVTLTAPLLAVIGDL